MHTPTRPREALPSAGPENLETCASTEQPTPNPSRRGLPAGLRETGGHGERSPVREKTDDCDAVNSGDGHKVVLTSACHLFPGSRFTGTAGKRQK